MFTLITAIILGIVFALFATQNTNLVEVAFSPTYIMRVPTYLLALGAILLGMVVSWIFNIIDNLSSAATIQGKNYRINKAEGVITSLQRRVHDLEVENAQLRGDKHEAQAVAEERKHPIREERTYPHESLMDRLRHGLSF